MTLILSILLVVLVLKAAAWALFFGVAYVADKLWRPESWLETE